MRGFRVGEASHPGPSSVLRLPRATSVVAVAPAQVDSDLFSALDEELSDTDVDEGGGELLSLLANVDESSNFGGVPSEVIAMYDAESPSRRLVMVSQQEVVTHSDGFAVSCQWGIARAFRSGV